MIHELREHRPLLWAWTLDSVDSPDIRFEQHCIHDSFTHQLSFVKQILIYIVQILARNRDLQSVTSSDHGTPDWRRSIVLGSAGCLFRWLPQAPEDRHVSRWSSEEWPEAAKEELQLLCQHLGWSRRSPFDGGSLDLPTGGHAEPDRLGHQHDGVSPMRPRLDHAHFTRDSPSMEHSAAKWRRLDFAQTDHVPDNFSGTDQPSKQAATDQAGRYPGHGVEGQRHSHRGSQVALPYLELRGQSPPTESEDSIDLGGHLRYSATDSPAGPKSGTDPEVCGSSTSEVGKPSSGHGSCHTLEAGCQPPWTGGLGTSHAAVETGRKRHYSACADADEAIQPAEITIGNSYFPTTSQVMRGLMTTSLLNDGSSCYINSVLQAQVWTSIMTSVFRPDLWGSWTQPILSMFSTHAGEAVFPCSSSCLAEEQSPIETIASASEDDTTQEERTAPAPTSPATNSAAKATEQRESPEGARAAETESSTTDEVIDLDGSPEAIPAYPARSPSAGTNAAAGMVKRAMVVTRVIALLHLLQIPAPFPSLQRRRRGEIDGDQACQPSQQPLLTE